MASVETLEAATTSLTRFLKEKAARIPADYFSGLEASFSLRVEQGVTFIAIKSDRVLVDQSTDGKAMFQAEMKQDSFDALVDRKSDVLTMLNTGDIKITRQADSKHTPLQVLQYAITLLLSNWYLSESAISQIEEPRVGYIQRAELPLIASSDVVQFRRNAEIGQPMLLGGMTQDWPICALGLENVREQVRDVSVSLLTREHGSDKPAEYTKSTLHDYLQTLSESSDEGRAAPYLAANAVSDEIAEMIKLPPQFPAEAFANTRMWVGPPGTGLDFHRDLIDNFIVQVFGRKKIRLIAPHHGKAMLPKRLGGNPFYHPSGHNTLERAESQIPDDVISEAIEVTLTEGEAIYLPAGWWHQVENETVSWSFNFFAVNQPPVVLNQPQQEQNQ